MNGTRLWLHLVLLVLLKGYESHKSDLDRKCLDWFRNTVKSNVPDAFEVSTWSFTVGDRIIKIQNLQAENLKHLLINRTSLGIAILKNKTIYAKFALDLTGVRMKGVIDVSSGTEHLRQGQIQAFFSGRGRFSAEVEKSSCLATFRATAVTIDDPNYNGQKPIAQGDPKKLNFELRKEVTKAINQKVNGTTVKLSLEKCQKLFA